jgi:hypothetical protein
MSDKISNFQGWSIVEAARRVPHLREHLSNGQLLAWGRLGNAGAAFAPIPVSKWAGKVTLAKTTVSRKPHAICDDESIFNLSVFPVLLAPNLVEHLGYVSLKAIFGRFVIGDPEVQYLGGIASAKVPDFLSLYREGRVEGNHYWPVRFEELCWLGEPDEISQKYMGYRSTPETDLAQRALRNRYEAMLNLLRSRHLVAEGDPTRPNDPQQIRSTIWESPTYYFDSRTGDLLEERDWGDEEVEIFRFDDGRENYVVRWRAVLLGPGAGRVEQVHENKIELTTSKSRKMTPKEKFECCFEFLKTQMKLSPDFRPKTKRLFWLDAREHCKAKISWPMFKDVWAKAKGVVPEAAPIWEKAGRSRKIRSKIIGPN